MPFEQSQTGPKISPHDAILNDICRFLDRFPPISYIADHGAGRQIRGLLVKNPRLPVQNRKPDIRLWIDQEEYLVNVTSGSLLKRDRLTQQILAWSSVGKRVICVVGSADKGILPAALLIAGLPPIHADYTVQEFKDFVNDRVKKISGGTPKPVEAR